MANCANCGKDLAFFNGGKNAVIKTMGGWGAQHLRFCSNRCIDEYQAREDAKHAAKVAKKEAKKAAKQATREEEEYESDGGSSSSSSGSGGMGVVGNVIGGVVLILLLIIVIGVIFSKNEDANDPAVKMAKWEEHLEKRRAAFAEGLSEEGIEARGLKNFTWEEWQNRSKAKAAEKPAEKVEDISEKYKAHMSKRMSLLNGGLTDKDLHEMGYDDYTLDAFKQNYKNIKYKTLEEIRHSAAVPTTPAAVPEKSAAQVDVADRAKAAAEAKAKKEAAIREKMEAKARMKAEAEAKARAKADAEAKTRARAQAAAKARAEAAAKAEAEAKAKAEARGKAEAKAKEDVSKVAAADAVGEQPNGTDRKKASADSKGIAITVQGKGKTKDAAVRYAIRQAVWKTVGTWVGSKSRMEEKREEVKAQVMTVTQDDVRKFEVLDTQQEGGSFVLKVKVHVSKKQIAPKFAKVFPDVFSND